MIDRDRAHLFLVGFMGSGKTTVATLVAERTGKNCVDLDAEIERQAGRTIPEIFSDSGEPGFRQLEAEILTGLASREASVIALGGGTQERFANRRLLRQTGLTVWLDLDLAEARRRIGSGVGRPRWNFKDCVDLRAFFERRSALYALADSRVRVAGTGPDAVATAIVAFFEGFFH